MNAQTFALWFERQGRRVVRTESSYWHSEGVRALQAFPYHWTIRPDEGELRQLLRETRAICLRYSTPVDAPLGHLSYHVVRSGPRYGINDLGKWARKNVRRGLRNCSVELISFDRLAREGWALQQETLARQKRNLRGSSDGWRQRCFIAQSLPGFEAWGALAGDRLAASVITFRMEDCVYLLCQQCSQEFLAAHVNNALCFTVTQQMLGRPGVRSVFYSLHSLDASPGMDEFKFRMGYIARVVRQRVLFHPVWAPMANPASHALLRLARAMRPGSPLLSKAEGMMRFYLEGKRLRPEPPRAVRLLRPHEGGAESQELPDGAA